jgi:hypothetical protein
MSEEPDEKKAVDRMAEDTRAFHEGLEAEVRQDIDKAKGEGGQPKRPWWKVWART